MHRSTALLLSLALGCVIRTDSSVTATDTATSSTGDGPATTSGPTTADPTTSGPTTTSTSATSAAPSTGAPATAGCNFVGCESDMPRSNDCDGWLMPVQDCPEGQKCTFEGEVWDTQCIDVVPNPKGLYEPCQILMGSGFSGHDDCGAGLFCWDIDPESGIGGCVGFCHGPAENPTCADPGATCTICQDCALGLCIPGCNPLLQNCKDGDVCISNADASGFMCTVDASGDAGEVFDPCEFSNACDPGLLCAPSDNATECDPQATGCCLPFCDLDAPTCPGDGLTCAPWFEPGLAPPGLKNVGLCRLPP